MAEHEAMARVWSQLARRYRLPRPVASAIVTAVRNGAEADAFVLEGRTRVFVHLPPACLASALLADLLARAGFAYDPEAGDWRY